MHAIAPHVYLADETVKVAHSHVPFSTFITARSRRLLREWIVKAKRGGRVYYADTDSVICDAVLPTSAGLGGLKNEYEIERGVFAGSKLYALEKVGPEPLDERQVVKAKGFSRVVGEGGDRTPIDYKTFCDLREGREVKVQRMLRIRELLRKYGPDYTPQIVDTLKSLKLATQPKRARLPGGESRPWTVEELSRAPCGGSRGEEDTTELEDLADEER
jgi:hypothetical protein